MSQGLADTSLFIARESGRPADVDALPDELAVSIITIGERRASLSSPGTTTSLWSKASPSPAFDTRRNRRSDQSHATGLDRNEVGALLVAAGLASARGHALVSLRAINELRVSEALGADIEQLGIERGHRTLTVLRKGGRIVTIPLGPQPSFCTPPASCVARCATVTL